MKSFLKLITFAGFLVVAAKPALACSNPMSAGQLKKVTATFQEMTSGGDGFKIDRCRNITVRYGDKVRKGKLHQLFAELNEMHHDTTYYGLIPKGEWSVYGNGMYLYHPDKTKSQSADWMIRYNQNTVKLLKLAGYKSDPNASKRAKILKRDLEWLDRPDIGQILGGLARTFSRAQSSGPANSPRYTVVTDNTHHSSHKHVVIQCRDGSRKKVFKEKNGSWGTGSFDLGNHTFEQTAKSLCY